MPNDTYKPDIVDRSSTPYVYDQQKMQWVPVSGNTSKGGSVPQNTNTSPQTTTVVVRINENSKVDSKMIADKGYIDIENNTLRGDLVLTATEKTIRLRVGMTVSLQGFGKYISGLFFIEEIKRTLDKDGGYTHTLTVARNGFGSSLKQVNVSVINVSPTPPPATPAPIPPAPAPADSPAAAIYSNGGGGSGGLNNANLHVGDKVRIVGANAVYSNADDGKRVPNWVKQEVHTVDKVLPDRVRLKEIWSWTYLKFITRA